MEYFTRDGDKGVDVDANAVCSLGEICEKRDAGMLMQHGYRSWIVWNSID